MSRRGIALGGILAILAVLIAARWEGPRIEHGLTVRAQMLLVERGVSGVQVRFDGRDAVLAGPGVSDQVVALVAGQPGVRRVRVDQSVQRTAAVLQPAPGAPSSPSATPSPGVERGSEKEPASRVARQIVELLGPDGLRFDPDSADLAAGRQAVLDRIAALLGANPTVRLQVSGYADVPPPAGGTALELSQRRAAAVADYLIAHGVAATVLTVAGYGDTRPVADNGTAEGRAANRRVEITVLGG
jgi:outer membrane protein OmpA-like peptidoglycan-associated protein